MKKIIQNLTEAEILKFQEYLEGKPPEFILQWSVSNFSPDIFMTSGFGPNSICVLNMLQNIKKDLTIYFIDTGYHFKETLNVREYYLEQGYNIKSISSSLSSFDYKNYRKMKLYETDPDLCCKIFKVDAFSQVMEADNCWIAPLRRDSSPSRKNISAIEKYDNGIIKVHPLASWRYDDVWKYIRENNLKYNELHDRNYKSIGCKHCTLPVQEDKHEREGRWSGAKKTECGIHTLLNKATKIKEKL